MSGEHSELVDSQATQNFTGTTEPAGKASAVEHRHCNCAPLH